MCPKVNWFVNYKFIYKVVNGSFAFSPGSIYILKYDIKSEVNYTQQQSNKCFESNC